MRATVHRAAIHLLCSRSHADGVGLHDDALYNLLFLEVKDFDEAVV